MLRLDKRWGDIALFDKRIKTIKENYNRVFLKDGYYYNSTANHKPDDRANALAVLSGLADKNQYDSILKVLQTSENALLVFYISLILTIGFVRYCHSYEIKLQCRIHIIFPKCFF